MRGEATKLLWQDPAYRKHMSDVHKWQRPPSRKGTPPNSGSFKRGHQLGRGRRKTEAQRRAISLRLRGSVPWNKGIGVLTSERKLARNSVKYKDWRDAVYERDDYTCQKCHIRGGALHPHHIESFAKFPALRYDIRNGITLCTIHHKEFHQIYGLRKFTAENLITYLN